MTTQQKAIIGAAIIIGFIFFQAKPKEALTSDQLQPIIKQTEKAFEEAEFDVFNIVPVDPDDKPLGPDPDPLKWREIWVSGNRCWVRVDFGCRQWGWGPLSLLMSSELNSTKNSYWGL